MSDQHFSLPQARESARRTQESLLETLSQAGDGALHLRAAEGAWSLAQVLAHVSEARQYFTAEAERLLASPGARVGRTMQDEARLAAVRPEQKLTAADLKGRLTASHTRLVSLLDRLTDADVEIAGEHVNPKFGRQTVGEFLQHFVVEHFAKHAEQAKRCLGNAGNSAIS